MRFFIKILDGIGLEFVLIKLIKSLIIKESTSSEKCRHESPQYLFTCSLLPDFSHHINRDKSYPRRKSHSRREWGLVEWNFVSFFPYKLFSSSLSLLLTFGRWTRKFCKVYYRHEWLFASRRPHAWINFFFFLLLFRTLLAYSEFLFNFSRSHL